MAQASGFQIGMYESASIESHDAPRLERRVRNHIGAELRRIYEGLGQPALPDHLAELINRLDQPTTDDLTPRPT